MHRRRLCNRPVKRVRKSNPKNNKSQENYPLIWRDFSSREEGKKTTQRLFVKQTRFNWTYALRDSISFVAAGSEAYACKNSGEGWSFQAERNFYDFLIVLFAIHYSLTKAEILVSTHNCFRFSFELYRLPANLNSLFSLVLRSNSRFFWRNLKIIDKISRKNS